MSNSLLKFKELSAKLVGSNVVCFKLEDGNLLKIHVELVRVGKAVDKKNPDGTPIYNFNLANRFEVKTKDGIFYAPLPPVPTRNLKDTEKSDGVV